MVSVPAFAKVHACSSSWFPSNRKFPGGRQHFFQGSKILFIMPPSSQRSAIDWLAHLPHACSFHRTGVGVGSETAFVPFQSKKIQRLARHLLCVHNHIFIAGFKHLHGQNFSFTFEVRQNMLLISNSLHGIRHFCFDANPCAIGRRGLRRNRNVWAVALFRFVALAT